ncbi:zinc finger and SCAN domain-containing protein 20-like isoform X2 [Rhineura floridana]|uniref:zinc finger and SCAN domain-containing protein 20-like isoform X2 n=1 Tax=Rhineura floridana TaxID=261503 RepID=UPI002AC872DE|nr:zinc finger and SCAN domain-containing protein 20-like isoform X2 [Rhineura floridana]
MEDQTPTHPSLWEWPGETQEGPSFPQVASEGETVTSSVAVQAPSDVNQTQLWMETSQEDNLCFNKWCHFVPQSCDALDIFSPVPPMATAKGLGDLQEWKNEVALCGISSDGAEHEETKENVWGQVGSRRQEGTITEEAMDNFLACLRGISFGEQEAENREEKHLDAYLRIHTEDKLDESLESGKIHIQSENLAERQMLKTKGKLYKCLQCGKGFASMSHLTTHQKSHAGEKTFACSAYRKNFGNHGNLKVHQSFYKKKKSYKCSECGKKFNRRSALKEHQRIHKETKQYKYTDCGNEWRISEDGKGPHWTSAWKVGELSSSYSRQEIASASQEGAEYGQDIHPVEEADELVPWGRPWEAPSETTIQRAGDLQEWKNEVALCGISLDSAEHEETKENWDQDGSRRLEGTITKESMDNFLACLRRISFEPENREDKHLDAYLRIHTEN